MARNRTLALTASRARRPLVVLESPFRASNHQKRRRLLAYARACLMDSITRGEAPFASHLLYTQPNTLNDRHALERAMGIGMGLAWGSCAERVVVYTDHGISEGMREAVQFYEAQGKIIEYRRLDPMTALSSEPVEDGK